MSIEEPGSPREWLIRKGGYFYRPGKSGYTTVKSQAGRYTELEARREAEIEPWHMDAIHQDMVPDPASDINVSEIASLKALLAATQEENRHLREIIRLCDRQLLALYNSISPHAEYVTSDGKSGNRFADQDAAVIAARSLYQDEANAPPISPRRAE